MGEARLTYWNFAVRRARARRGLLLLIMATVAFIAAVVSAVVGHVQLASTDALREVAAAPFTDDSYFRVHTGAADDPIGQLDAAAAQFRALSLDEGLTITNAYYVDPLEVDVLGALPASLAVLPLAWDPAADSTVVDGTIEQFVSSDTSNSASEVVPAAISAEAADSSNLSVGDTVQVKGANGHIVVEVVAVVMPGREDAPLFLPVPSQNIDAGQPFVVAVPQTHLAAFSDLAKVQWVFKLDPANVTATGLPRLTEGLADLPQVLMSDRLVSSGGLIPSGGLAGVLATATEATQSVKAVTPVALVLLTVLSVVTLVQVSRLLAESREVEDSLVAARGASSTQLTTLAAVEIVAVASAASLGGWLAAAAAVPLAGSWPGSFPGWLAGAIEFATATWPIPLACVLVATGAFIGPSYVAARRRQVVGGMTSVGRGGRVASFGLLTAIALLTGLSVWQFMLYGSPLSQSADGRVDVNPLAAPAPALLLLAFTAAILVIVAATARAVERMYATRPGLSRFLASAQVSRRITTLLIPTALISLTVGAATFTAVYTETAAVSQRTAAQLANGSAVRVMFPGPSNISVPSDIPDLNAFSSLAGVSDASRVYRGTAKIGSEDVPLVALDSLSLGGLVDDDSGLLDTDALGAKLTPSATAVDPNLVLPAETTSVRLELLSSPVTGEMTSPPDANRLASVTIWILDGSGHLVPVDAGSFTLTTVDSQAHTLDVELPSGLSPIGIAALDVFIAADEMLQGHAIEIVAVTGDRGGGTSDAGFDQNSTIGIAPDAVSSGLSEPTNLSPGVGAVFPPEPFQGSRTGARLMPSSLSRPPVPVAITSALLETLDLDVGSEVTVRQGGVELPAVIQAEVPVVPGTTESAAILVDLHAYGQAMLATSSVQPRPGEIWLGTVDHAASEPAVAAVIAGTGATLFTSTADVSARFLAPGTTALWLGAIGSLAIGGVAIGVCLVALVRSREQEVAILRALGLGARRQAGSRRGEFQAVSIAAMILGVAAGAAVALLLAGPLVEAVLVGAADTLRAPLRLAAYPLVAFLLGQGLLVGLAAWYYGMHVQRQASRRPVPGRSAG
ncbi:hypothetical protein GCM10009582_19770 [Arthrobacter flavus]